MELILVSRNAEIRAISKSQPIAGLAVNVTQLESVEEAITAARLDPSALVAIDLDSADIDLAKFTEINSDRLITLGPQADPRLKVLQHLVIDNQGNFWAVLLLFAKDLKEPATPATNLNSITDRLSTVTPESGARVLNAAIVYAISESASTGLIAVNERGTVTDASEQLILTFQDRFGSPGGQAITSLMGTCQQDNLEEFIRDSAPGTVGQFEFVDNRQDPSTTWLLMGHLVVNAGAQHLVGIVRNITLRRQGEETIRNAAAKNQAIFDTLPDGICVLDHEFMITACNNALTELLGYPLEGLIDRHVSVMTGSEYWENRGPEMLDALEHQTDLGHRKIFHRDGHTIDVEVNQTRIGSGHQRQYFAAFRDLSERKAARRQLDASEARYQTIFSAIPDGIAITTQAGEFLEVNRAYCELAGYSREELIGKNISVLADDQDQLKQFYQTVINDQRAYAQAQATRHDGQMVRWSRWTPSAPWFPPTKPMLLRMLSLFTVT